MQERDKALIAKAKQGDSTIMTQIIEENKRTNMEYSKEIFRKRI